MVRTKPCSPEVQAARLKKANDFLEAAIQLEPLIDDESGAFREPYIVLCVHAGIAASDVICCNRYRRHSIDGDHDAAVDYLKQFDSENAGYLEVLLDIKSTASYTEHHSSHQHRLDVGVAAKAIVANANRI